MSERPNSAIESLFNKGPAIHFEQTLLRGAFMQCVDDIQNERFSFVRREGNISTYDGEKKLEFWSSYDHGARTREYFVSINESETELFSGLPEDMRQQLREEAKEMILEESINVEEADEYEIAETLHDDSWWQRLHNPDQYDDIHFTLETGWLFHVVDGYATKHFVAKRYFDGELMDEGTIGEVDGEGDFEDSVTNDMIIKLSDITEDLSQVDDDDLAMLEELLTKLGLTTQKTRNRYRRGLKR